MKNYQTDSKKAQGEHEERRTLRVFNYQLHKCWRTIRAGVATFVIDFREQIVKLKTIIEISALLGLVLYTCETRRTNNLTQSALSEYKRSADAAQGQFEIMQKQLETTDRPWVTVDVTACNVCGEGDLRGGPLVFDKDGDGRLTFTVTYKNVGKSVANRVLIRVNALALGALDHNTSVFATPVAEQTQLCSEPPKTSRIDLGRAVFPGEPQPETIGPMGFATKQIPPPPEELHLKSGKPITLFLIGCVDYEYSSPSVRHQSGFLYWINQVNPRKVIQTLDTIPVNRLAFERYELGGWYAY